MIFHQHRGAYIQRGHGFASILSTIGRFFKPIARSLFGSARKVVSDKAIQHVAKQTIKNIGKAGLESATNVASDTISDVIKGKSIKQSIQDSGKKEIEKAKGKILKKISGNKRSRDSDIFKTVNKKRRKRSDIVFKNKRI